MLYGTTLISVKKNKKTLTYKMTTKINHVYEFFYFYIKGSFIGSINNFPFSILMTFSSWEHVSFFLKQVNPFLSICFIGYRMQFVYFKQITSPQQHSLEKMTSKCKKRLFVKVRSCYRQHYTDTLNIMWYMLSRQDLFLQ